MDSLHDILSRKDFDEPPEIVAIKKFVEDTFQEEVGVSVREREIIVHVRSASLANALRLKITQMQKAANTTKRVVFRIG